MNGRKSAKALTPSLGRSGHLCTVNISEVTVVIHSPLGPLVSQLLSPGLKQCSGTDWRRHWVGTSLCEQPIGQ